MSDMRLESSRVVHARHVTRSIRSAFNATISRCFSRVLRAFTSELRACVCVFACFAISYAHADLPGTMPLSAAGEGHLWWIVAREPSTAESTAREYLLMHHASVEAAPTERLVLALPTMPEGIAAEGADVVIVMRAEGARKRMVLTLTAARNPSMGHWYNHPRQGPRVLPPLDGEGELRALAMVKGQLHALLRLPRTLATEPERWWLGAMTTQACVGGAWQQLPLPPLDFAEPVLLAAIDGTLEAVGTVDRGITLVRWNAARNDAAIERVGDARVTSNTVITPNESPAFAPKNSVFVPARELPRDLPRDLPRVPPSLAGAWEVRPLLNTQAMSPRTVMGIISVGGSEVLVRRVSGDEPGADKLRANELSAESETAPTAIVSESSTARATSFIRLERNRQGQLTPWAEFAQPRQPWSLASFAPGDAGIGAALLVLDGKSRGTIALISQSASTPTAPTLLEPPSFSARSWMHVPILGVLSILLVLGAVVFGSDAYLANRARGEIPNARVRKARLRGADPFKRVLAFCIDLAPGLCAVWAVVGGNPLDLIEAGIFVTDVSQQMPAIYAMFGGWAFASLGDIAFGRSLGKRIVRLRIIRVAVAGADVSATSEDADGTKAQHDADTTDWFPRASMARRTMRALLSIIVVASPLCMIVAYLNPDRDGPAEMLTGTAVVEE